jgi:hypothetical protein
MILFRKSILAAVAGILFASTPASAQDASTQIGNATVTVGAGTALLTLPDVPSFMTATTNGAPFTQRQACASPSNSAPTRSWSRSSLTEEILSFHSTESHC